MKSKKEDDLTLPLTEAEIAKKKKKNGNLKYVICVGLVLVLTVFSLVSSLFSAGGGSSWGSIADGALIIWESIKNSSIGWMLGTLGIVFFTYCIDGLIILVFCRLYTRHYHFIQGLANTLIGAFYSAVTPGASGGQVMQVYTLKKQGIEVSNAASIMVMWFILYQSNLIVFDILAILVEWNKILSISSFTFTFGSFSITLLPLIVIGFALNLGTLALLFLMSYSHRFHNFIMHYMVNFLAKLHIIKNPDKSRENLRVQVENFKIELRRLQSNVPVTILLSIMFLANFFLRFSIPYFTGLSLHSVGDFSFMKMMDTCFLSAFHQMVTGVFPIPGGAGVSELFFATIFKDIIGATTDASGAIIRSAEVNMASAQILWRTATFHIVVIISGFVSALYRGRPQENYSYANRQTFVNLQLETYETRKVSADTLYETSQLSKKNIANKLGSLDTNEDLPTKTKRKKNKNKKKDETFLG
jgi:uncharacterized protein (TIRG00374 family)